MLTSKPSLTTLAATLKEPLHSKVRQHLRKLILNGFQHGQRFYSERELIKRLKVSQPTVRRALADLSREGYLIPSTRRGFFVHKQIATRYLSFCLPATGGVDRNIEEASVACRQRGYELNTYYVHKEDTVQNVLDKIEHKASEERIVILGHTIQFTLELSTALTKNGYDNIVVGGHIPGYTGNYYGLDHDWEVTSVLDHLHGLGHQKITFIVNEPSILLVTSRRAEAVKRKLAENNLTQCKLIYCDTPNWTSSYWAAHSKVNEILKEKDRPTAIAPLSGVGAWAAERCLIENKVDCPGEIALFCFDPLPGNDILPVPLSSFEFSFSKRAHRLLDLLWESTDRPIHELLRPELIARNSTVPTPPQAA